MISTRGHGNCTGKRGSGKRGKMAAAEASEMTGEPKVCIFCRPELLELVKQLHELGANVVTTESALREDLSVSRFVLLISTTVS